MLAFLPLLLACTGTKGPTTLPEEPAPGPAPATLTEVAGLWVNENSDTHGRPQLRIHVSQGHVVVEAWGRCTPMWCYWGSQLADARDWESQRRLYVTWATHFHIVTDTLTAVAGPGLETRSGTRFIDTSGRAPLHLVERFRRAPAP